MLSASLNKTFPSFLPSFHGVRCSCVVRAFDQCASDESFMVDPLGYFSFLPSLQVDARLARSEKLRGMVQLGIPHSLRAQIWMRLSGALDKKLKSDLSYKDVVKASSNDHLMSSKQIEKVTTWKNERTNEWMLSSKQIEKVTTQTNEWMMSSKQIEKVTTRTNERMMSSEQIEKVTTRTNERMMSSKQIEKVTTRTNERMNDVFKTDRKGNYTNERMNEWCLRNRSKR